MDIEPDKTITTGEAAAILGVSRATLASLCDNGTLPYARPTSHRILSLADVLEYRDATTFPRPVADGATSAPRYVDYVIALTRNFDDPTTGGAARMGAQMLAALREVHPALYDKLSETDIYPFDGEHARPEVEEWIAANWNEAGGVPW